MLEAPIEDVDDFSPVLIGAGLDGEGLIEAGEREPSLGEGSESVL